jgi:hypothetical protein
MGRRSSAKDTVERSLIRVCKTEVCRRQSHSDVVVVLDVDCPEKVAGCGAFWLRFRNQSSTQSNDKPTDVQKKLIIHCINNTHNSSFHVLFVNRKSC